MNLSELTKKPIEEMTDEELKQLELIGKREYDREYRERNREKRHESIRRSRIKKGLQTLKESDGAVVPKQKEKRVNQEDAEFQKIKDSFLFSAARNGYSEKRALEEAMKDWVAKNW